MILLILEYFSLFFMMEVEQGMVMIQGSGSFFSDPMYYASIEPMPTIFRITVAVIVVGIAVAVCSAVFMWAIRKE